MKCKAPVQKRPKGSLQKTSSSFINIPTHRNSVISDTHPLFYNDSLLSVRTSSLHHTHKHLDLPHPPNAHTEASLKHKRQVKELTHLCVRERSNKKMLVRVSRPSSSINAGKEKLNSVRLSGKREYNKRSSVEIHLPTREKSELHFLSNQASSQEKQRYEQLLRQTKQVLEGYRLQTEQVEQKKNMYKEKYKEVLKKLKKYEKK